MICEILGLGIFWGEGRKGGRGKRRWREGGKRREREGRREGGMEGGREEERKEGREGGREEEREREREGGREGGEGGRETTNQRAPVGVEVSNPESWYQLSEGNHKKVEIQEKPELLKQNLCVKTKNNS